MLKIKIAIGSMILLLAGLAGYWHYSPYLVMSSMRSAAEQRDAQAFNAHVDYPRLRESIKSQMNEVMAAPIADAPAGNTGFAAMGAALARAIINPMIDMMVSPEFMMTAMKKGDLGVSGAQPDTGAQAELDKKVEWTIQRDGVNRVVATPITDTKPQDKQPSVVFERSGFATWKLVSVHLR